MRVESSPVITHPSPLLPSRCVHPQSHTTTHAVAEIVQETCSMDAANSGVNSTEDDRRNAATTTASLEAGTGLESSLLPILNMDEPTVLTNSQMTPASPAASPSDSQPHSSLPGLPRPETRATPSPHSQHLHLSSPFNSSNIASSSNSVPAVGACNEKSTRQGAQPHQRTTQPSHSSSTVQRLLNTNNYSIPHFDARVRSQMRYIENSCISGISDHVAAVKKIFMLLLHLQLRLPPTSRLHLLFESEHRPQSSSPSNSSGHTAYDLFSLFSPTISTESRARQDNISMIGEVIADYSILCNTERHTSSPQPGTPSPGFRTTSQPSQHNSSNTSVRGNEMHKDPAPALPSTFPESQQHSSTGHPTQASSRAVSSRKPPPRPTTSTAQGTDAIPIADGEDDINQDWFIPDEYLLSQMTLPQWFPAPPAEVSPHCTNGILTVPIDKYTALSHDQSFFVYRTILRVGHKKSLLETERPKYEKSPHFKHVFNFKTFNPPWFVASLLCTVKGRPLFSKPLRFEHPSIPQLRQLRSRTSRVVLAKLHGLISSFKCKEPAFAAATIEYLIQKSRCIPSNLSIPSTPSPTTNLHSPTAVRGHSSDQPSPSSAAAFTSTQTARIHPSQPSTSRRRPPPSSTGGPSPGRIQPVHVPQQDENAGHDQPVTQPVVDTHAGHEQPVSRPRTLDPPLPTSDPDSPLNNMMAAFRARYKRRSAKRKRNAAAGLSAIDASEDSSDQDSSSDSESSEFVPHTKRRRTDSNVSRAEPAPTSKKNLTKVQSIVAGVHRDMETEQVQLLSYVQTTIVRQAEIHCLVQRNLYRMMTSSSTSVLSRKEPIGSVLGQATF